MRNILEEAFAELTTAALNIGSTGARFPRVDGLADGGTIEHLDELRTARRRLYEAPKDDYEKVTRR